MWLAHALTLSRIPIAIALWSVWGQPAPAAALIALAALTDTADGRAARWAKRHGKAGPDIGGWLDPAVDKLFVAIVLAAIWVQTRQVELLVLLGAREIVLVPLIGIYVARRVPHRKLQADAWGKAATVMQFIALCVIAIAPSWSLPAAAVAGALGLVAASHYVARAIAEQRAPAGERAGARDTPRG